MAKKLAIDDDGDDDHDDHDDDDGDDDDGMMIMIMPIIMMMIWRPSAKPTHASKIYEPADWQKMGLASYCQCFAPPLLPTKISINVPKWPTTILEGIE